MNIANKPLFRLTAILGVLGMVAATAGAHGIEFEPGQKELFDTGLLYLFVHLPVLMVLSVVGVSQQAYMMTTGLILFSVPLITKGIGLFDGGIIVPIGVMLIIAAWVWLIFVGNPASKEE